MAGLQPLVNKSSAGAARTETADADMRKNYTQSGNRNNSLKTSEVRQSLKMGKRRANSNHVEKKMNLDKFLSVVQNSQRANYTPSSQLNNKLITG